MREYIWNQLNLNGNIYTIKALAHNVKEAKDLILEKYHNSIVFTSISYHINIYPPTVVDKPTAIITYGGEFHG